MNLTTSLLFSIVTTLVAFSAQAENKFPTEYCSNRAVDLNLGKEDMSVRWFGGNLCVLVYPNMKDIRVLLYPSGSIQFTGEYLGLESMPREISLRLEPLKSEQRGSNRKFNLMKIKGLQADLYLTIFTTMDGSTQDSIAILSYHSGQIFELSNENYVKTEAEVAEGFPEKTISLMRSVLF